MKNLLKVLGILTGILIIFYAVSYGRDYAERLEAEKERELFGTGQ